MSTTPAPAASSPLGAEIKGIFNKIGRELTAVGNETLKIIGLVQKNIPALAPGLNATIGTIFGPDVALSVAGVEKIAQVCLAAASAVAQALVAEGLNPTLDETAATTVAGVIHGTGASATAASAGAAS